MQHCCRRCGSPDIRTSRFRAIDYVRVLLLLRPVRCRECGRRSVRLLFAH
jgi:hypothetical protein